MLFVLCLLLLISRGVVCVMLLVCCVIYNTNVVLFRWSFVVIIFDNYFVVLFVND